MKDLIKQIENLKEEDKKELMNWIMKDYFKAFVQDEVLFYKDSKFVLDGKVLPPIDAQNIISGAKAMNEMDFYKVLLRDLEITACKKIYLASKSMDETFFGKAMLYCVDFMRKKTANVASLEVAKPVKVKKKK